MDRQTAAPLRLAGQQLLRSRFRDAAALVRWMGAVQAQDYFGALWALGLRLPSVTERHIEDAVAAGTIVRTWPMRRTLHFVPAEDVGWMLQLLASRMIRLASGRYRALGIEASALERSARILQRALEGGRQLTRPEAYAVLTRGGVATDSQRGIHILAHHAQQGLLCLGPRKERQPTFVLLDEWVPKRPSLSREESLATLATRYFQSHGPATLQDFAWWSGLPVKDVREAVGQAGGKLRARADGSVACSTARAAPRSRVPIAGLLPPWDEYMVAYRDRSIAADGAKHAGLALLGRALVVIDGRVRGTWRRTLTPARLDIDVELWGKVSADEKRAVARAERRYRQFLGRS